MRNDVPCTTLVPLCVFDSLQETGMGEKTRKCWIIHSNCHFCANCKKKTNSQKNKKLESHKDPHNSNTTCSHPIINITKRCVFSSSLIWPPQICCRDQNSWWYAVCRKPCLFCLFFPSIFGSRGIVNWRRGFRIYKTCDECIRCVCLRSWIWPPQICCCDQNSWCMLFAANRVSSVYFCRRFFGCRGIVNWRRGFQIYGTCDECIRCVCLSSWIWPPQICCRNQNSWWYAVCREPCLFCLFLPLIFGCWGIVNWRRGFRIYGTCDECIRCVCLSTSIWPPQICCCDQNLQWYAVCRELCLSSRFSTIFSHASFFIKGECTSYDSSSISSRVFKDFWSMAEEWEQSYQGPDHQEGQGVSRWISNSCWTIWIVQAGQGVST